MDLEHTLAHLTTLAIGHHCMPSALFMLSRGPDKIRILNTLVLAAKCGVVNYRGSQVVKKRINVARKFSFI